LLRAPAGAESPALRQVILSDASLTAGQTGTVLVSLQGQGNETALGFSVSFDPVGLRFVNAGVVSGVTGVTLNVNSENAATGQLGFLLGRTGNNSFAAGKNPLIQITFQPALVAGGEYPIGFGDG